MSPTEHVNPLLLKKNRLKVNSVKGSLFSLKY